MSNSSGIDGVKNPIIDEKAPNLGSIKNQVNIHQYLNTLLVPLIGFLIWNKVSDIEADIKAINDRLEIHTQFEQSLDNRVQALEDKIKERPEVKDRLYLEAILPDKKKK